MSDPTPRTITGLAPRRDTPPLARLMKSERERNTDTPAIPPAAATAVQPAAPRAEEPPTRRAPSAAADDAKVAVTFRLPVGLRKRSRAVFVATRTAESDETYSDMVAKAIENEVRRREALYNGGQPYGGGEAPLASGRPFSG